MKITKIGWFVGLAVLLGWPLGLWGFSNSSKVAEATKIPLCSDVFVNAVQSHSHDGRIRFYGDAKLLQPSSMQLQTSQVLHYGITSEPLSCEAGPCYASKQLSPQLGLLDFQESVSKLVFHRVQSRHLTMHDYHRLDILPNAVVQLSNPGEVFKIRELILKDNAELSLASGTYWIHQLTLSRRARIHIRKNARVRLYVHEPVTMAPDSSINYSGKPWQLFVYAMQDWTMQKRSEIRGFLYAKNKVTLQPYARLFGGISASEVKLKRASKVKWTPKMVRRLQAPNLCRVAIDIGPTEEAGGHQELDPLTTQPDVLPPKIRLNGATTTETEAGWLAGRVRDAQSHIRGIWLDVNGATLRVPFDRRGVFQIKVPLVVGRNPMRLHALDDAGNHTYIDLNLRRMGQSAVIVLKPPDQAILDQAQQSISGVIQLGYPQADPLILFQNRPIPFTPLHSDPLDLNALPRYAFKTSATLNFGKNEFELSWQDEQGIHRQTLVYDYRPNLKQIPIPDIRVLTPSTGAYISNQKIQLKATIDSVAPPLMAELWLADRLLKRMPVVATHAAGFILSEQIDIPTQDNHLLLTLKVIDALSQQSTTTLDLYQDATAPIITLDQTFKAWPEINEIPKSQLDLSGTIRDANLNSFTINQKAIHLTAIGQDVYRFQAQIKLALNDQTSVTLQAIDASGNQSQRLITLKSTQDLALTWVAPRLQSRYPLATSDSDPVMALTAMATFSTDGFSGNISAILSGPQGNRSLVVERQSSLLSTKFVAPSQPGPYQLDIVATADQGTVVKLKQRVEFYDAKQLPLKVLAVTPAINAKGVEPDTFISFQFNRRVDPKELTLEVSQTAHGLTYVDTRKHTVEQGASDREIQFLFAKGHELQPVNLDRAPVQYKVSVLPGQHSFAFYSKEMLAYQAKVFVSLSYQGNEISRYQFQTRPLPTFIEGTIFDVVGRPVADAEVRLKELNRLTTTNSDGAFSFGYEDSPAQAIPGGTYHLLVNSSYRLNNLGSVNAQVDVEGGRRNLLNIIRLPSMDNSIAYQHIDWQAKQVSLSSGELILNLEQAELLFPKGIERRVHVEFVPAQGIVTALHHRFAPSWIYQIHPLGIVVHGTIGLEMKIPALRGGYSHVPDTSANPYYVLILGYSGESRLIQPIGIAQIKGTTVYSLDTHPIPFTHLEAIGYFLPTKDDQVQIKDYLTGRLSWLALLTALDH